MLHSITLTLPFIILILLTCGGTPINYILATLLLQLLSNNINIINENSVTNNVNCVVIPLIGDELYWTGEVSEIIIASSFISHFGFMKIMYVREDKSDKNLIVR